MKIFIILVHIVLGLLLIFSSVNTLLHLYQVTQNTSSYYPDYLSNTGVQDFVQNIRDTLPQRIASAALWIILGLFSVIGALAFRKNKRWSSLTLPLLPLGICLWLVYSVYSASASEVAWTGGIMMFVAAILFIFFILETAYIAFRKPVLLDK